MGQEIKTKKIKKTQDNGRCATDRTIMKEEDEKEKRGNIKSKKETGQRKTRKGNKTVKRIAQGKRQEKRRQE